MIPSCDHTGTPRHFHSSTTSGSACLISARIRDSILPLQSPSSLILSSISLEGDSSVAVALFFALFFAVVVGRLVANAEPPCFQQSVKRGARRSGHTR